MKRLIKKVLRDPSWLLKLAEEPLILNRLWHKRLSSDRYNPRGTNFLKADWDNLILLDACRYDFFEEINDLEGHLESRESLGACSNEFVSANFDGTEFHDTVIVTANGWYRIIDEKPNEDDLNVHDLIVVDEYERNEVQKQFAEVRSDRKWVVPEATTEYARRALEKYPNKRLLIHYHQPHSPYIGETGMEYFDELPHKLAGTTHIETSHEILRQAYRENLELVLKEVTQLLPELPGKTVISADHGEMLGERDFPVPVHRYGHPCGIYHKHLAKVPWFVIENGPRKEVVAEPPVEREDVKSLDAVHQRLEELGYKM